MKQEPGNVIEDDEDDWANADFTAAEPSKQTEEDDKFPALHTVQTIESNTIMDLGSLTLDDLEFPTGEVERKEERKEETVY